MKTKRFTFIAAVLTGVVMFASCDKDNDIHRENMVVRFTGTINEQPLINPITRAYGAEWEKEDAIGVFMIGHTDSEVVEKAENKKYITSGNGTFTQVDGDLFYPTNVVDFIAYYPYIGDVMLKQKIKVEIGNQTKQKDFDLLYAKSNNNGVGYTKNNAAKPVALNFEHKLSKIVLNCKQFKNLASMDNMTVTIKGMRNNSTFDLLSGKLDFPENKSADIIARKLATATPSFESSYDAIIMPSSYEKEEISIEFSINGETFTWTNKEKVEFEGGFEYTYEVNDTPHVGIKMTAFISPWNIKEGGFIRPEKAKDFPTKVFKNVETVFIPAGIFKMGSPETEEGRSSDEIQQEVNLTKSFYMSKYEITNAQYALFLNENKIGKEGKWNNWSDETNKGKTLIKEDYERGLICIDGVWKTTQDKADFPIVYVSWYGAKAYADWIGGSLPTEAQWEYACRGNQKESLPYGIGDGRILTKEMANIADKRGRAKAIGSYPYANGYGLYDMHGNVREWCEDWKLNTSLLTKEDISSITGASEAAQRVVRGGCWYDKSKDCRSASRKFKRPDFTDKNLGFRVIFVQ